LPDTDRLIFPLLLVKLTLPLTDPAVAGQNLTVTCALWFAPRLKELPETILKGTLVEALPFRVPPPAFLTVKLWLLEHWPTVTSPKLSEFGVTSRIGGASLKVAVTDLLAFIMMVQLPVPLQAPLQPAKVEPEAAVAVRVTEVPLG
jgi:hypothetical protein